MSTPWHDPTWQARAEAESQAALSAAGRPVTGPARVVQATVRACIRRVPTAGGEVWIKHAYALPPREERVLEVLASRRPERLPSVVAVWPGAVATDPLPGVELSESAPLEDWTAVAAALGALLAEEVGHVDAWLELGVRDRRPVHWAPAVEALLESPVVTALDADVLAGLRAFAPEFIHRYVEAWTGPATLVSQDSGCCNIHITDEGPIFYDWSDVVIGHPVFSCDRLLDQAPAGSPDAIIAAFSDPLGLAREDYDAIRRSAVLHEVLRYHDELAYLAPGDGSYETLHAAVQSQLRVLVEFEAARR